MSLKRGGTVISIDMLFKVAKTSVPAGFRRAATGMSVATSLFALLEAQYYGACAETLTDVFLIQAC